MLFRAAKSQSPHSSHTLASRGRVWPTLPPTLFGGFAKRNFRVCSQHVERNEAGNEPVKEMKAQAKHTPGSWYAQFTRRGATIRDATEGLAIAIIKDRKDGPQNARLIAAAPELLEALRRLALAVESIASHEPGATRDEMIERLHIGYENQLIAARAAIAKAKGNL
jgi:hypothetical protein